MLFCSHERFELHTITVVNDDLQSCVKRCFRKSGFQIPNENEAVCDIYENEEIYQHVKVINIDLTLEEYVQLPEHPCTDNTSDDVRNVFLMLQQNEIMIQRKIMRS